jgi:hypothetical protein
MPRQYKEDDGRSSLKMYTKNSKLQEILQPTTKNNDARPSGKTSELSPVAILQRSLQCMDDRLFLDSDISRLTTAMGSNCGKSSLPGPPVGGDKLTESDSIPEAFIQGSSGSASWS